MRCKEKDSIQNFNCNYLVNRSKYKGILYHRTLLIKLYEYLYKNYNVLFENIISLLYHSLHFCYTILFPAHHTDPDPSR